MTQNTVSTVEFTLLTKMQQSSKMKTKPPTRLMYSQYVNFSAALYSRMCDTNKLHTLVDNT